MNFLGRPEPIFSYNNTTRSLSLSFRLLIDTVKEMQDLKPTIENYRAYLYNCGEYLLNTEEFVDDKQTTNKKVSDKITKIKPETKVFNINLKYFFKNGYYDTDTEKVDYSVLDTCKEADAFGDPDKKDNPLFWMGKFISTLNPIDRTGVFNILKTDYSPIPDVDVFFNKSFDDICYSTATYYWEKHDNITLLWSGGFDSTCVAISFIETKLKDKKLTLLGTQESVEEYPSFYEANKHLIKIEEHEVFWNRFALPQNETTYITGDIGDQIFGGCIDEYPNYKNDDWDSFIGDLQEIFSNISIKVNFNEFD
jgi:hypothetical protein